MYPETQCNAPKRATNCGLCNHDSGNQRFAVVSNSKALFPPLFPRCFVASLMRHKDRNSMTISIDLDFDVANH